MNAVRILWAVCAVITSSNWAHANDECVVVGPNALRVGSRETLAIMVSGRTRRKVDVSLERHRPGRGVFFRTTVDAAPGVLKIAELLVNSTDLPDFQPSQEDAAVKLNVACGGLWTRDVLLPVSAASDDYFFLQTDQPIYHPGATVKVRFIALNGSLAPSSSPFRLEIRNPQNVVLDVKDFNPAREIMLNHNFDVPKHTVLGEWTLVMRYGHKYQQNTTTTFAVEKYVLPRFSVKLSTVDYILRDFQNVTVGVRAKFVNQEQVRGFVSFRFSVKNELGVIEDIGTTKEPIPLEGGDATYLLKRDDVVKKFGLAKLAALFKGGARLVIEATVIEEATGLREIGRSEKAVFSSSPYLVSTARSETSFKPGTKFYIMAEVKYANGEPAKDVETKLTIAANNPRGLKTARTNEYGVATFLVTSRASDAEYKFKVETAEPSIPQEQQASSDLTMKAYKSQSGKYIAIERKDPKAEIKSGSTYEASLFKPENSRLTSAHYVVVSRGRVLEAGKVITDHGVLDPKVAFTVTPEMTPSFRLVVVGFVDGQLVTDAVYVNAEPTCTLESQFTMARKDGNSPLEPGDPVSFLLRGKAGTRVGLLGVDQAMYLLRRKDLLTREKVFESMQAKDTGHGHDAGTTVQDALTNSGVMALLPQGAYGVRADGRRRAKRDVKMDMEKKFEDETLRDCCSRGMRPDQLLRSCSQREEALRIYLDSGSANYSAECVQAFAECCSYVEENEAVARSGGGRDVSLSRSDFMDFEGQERRDFKETWIFDAYTIDERGESTCELSVPDSITTWELSAVGVSPNGGICVIKPLEVRVFKKFFVEVNLPYSVVQNEQVEIPATVYNYDSKDRKVTVALLGTKDVCPTAKEGKIASVHEVDVPKGQGRTVVFPVVPLSHGQLEIRIGAKSDQANDLATVTLRVEPPGVAKSESFNLILEPQNPRNRKGRSKTQPTYNYTETFAVGGKQLIQLQRRTRSAQEVVPGSERCEIDIVGDDMGAALEASVKDPQNLLKMPTGCGEQTMIALAPTLYAYEYLKTARRMLPPDEDKALGFIREGYRRILTFRKQDGSFTVWQGYSSSLWLTAFVVRTLCEAQKSIHVDENVIISGLRYIMKQQGQDGSFKDIYKLHHSDLLGGVDGPIPLTAYTILTLQECSKEGVQAPGLTDSFRRASMFIEKGLKPDTSSYVLSLALYALSFGDSSVKHDALQKLRATLQIGKDGGLFVSAATEPLSVQATSYALMTLLNAGEERDTVMALVQWLNLRMNPSGALSSSQDTVVALQALSKYAIYARDSGIDLTCEVTLSNDRNFNRTVRIKRDNAQIRNRIEIPESGDKVFINVKGTGTATMYVVTSYDAPIGLESLCKFDLNATFTQTKVTVQEALKSAKAPKARYSMKVCARSLDKDITGMAILDVGLLTGFKPISDDLDKLVANKQVDWYEYSKRSAIFYLPPIPTEANVCVEFGLKQEFAAGKLQSGSVKAYAYYNPDFSCTKFYSPDSTSPLLKIDCKNPGAGHSEVCKCLEGGCPPNSAEIEQAFTRDSDNKPLEKEECQEEFRAFACDEMEFVWLGTARHIAHRNGFLTVRLTINNVLKPGIESEEDLLNRTRTIKARDNCDSVNLTVGKTYIVMGKDAKSKEKDTFGEEKYVYVIDRESVIVPFPYPPVRKGRLQNNNLVKKPCYFDKLLTWFKNEFSNESTRCLT